MQGLARAILATAIAALFLAAPAAADSLRSHQWGLDVVASDQAHAITRGDGALVAVVDTGANLLHEDLIGRVLPGQDFVDGGLPTDGNGHGTHVSGIIAANQGNGRGVGSVAPGAKVLAVRVLGNDGSGTNEQVAAGIRYAANSGAHVINLSLSEDVPLSPLGVGGSVDQAIDYALDRGVVVVGSAGNNGLPVCEQPSGQGRLVCVGAIDRRGAKTFYSSYGRGLSLVAPGGSGLHVADEDVLSTYLPFPSSYAELAGTSQAAPHVAGVAALLASQGLRGQEIVRRMLATATDAGAPGPDPVYGAGIVNARAAVAAGSAGVGPAGAGSAAAVSVPRVQRIRTVLRRGVAVRCRGVGRGRCQAQVIARRRRIAAGGAAVRVGRRVTVRARVSRSGRRMLRRVRRRLSATVFVTLPGIDQQVRPVTLRR